MALVYAATISWEGTQKGANYKSMLSGRFPHRWQMLDSFYPACGE